MSSVNKISSPVDSITTIKKINEIIDNLGGEQVQADWSQTDDSAVDYIKNKPTIPDVSGKEDVSNKVTTISSSSTDTQYPSAKCVYDELQDVKNLINVTYSELVALKTAGTLKEGTYYRMTDYVTTTNETGLMRLYTSEKARSAGHAFDLIIQATSNSTLSEICSAAVHAGDTYFANYNLGGWQIWYDINNDTDKYAWADTTNGKGVIYRLIDERGNDLPYDFKNIQFLRNPSSTNRYNIISSYLTSSSGYYYTFSYIDNGTVEDLTLTGTLCSENKLALTENSNKKQLNNNVFIALDRATSQMNGNIVDRNNYRNTIVSHFYSNSCKVNFHSNILFSFALCNVGDNFITNSVSSIDASAPASGLVQCTFGSYFRNNNIGHGVNRCSFGNFYGYSNIGINVSYCTVGHGNGYVNIADSCTCINIGNSNGYVNMTISNCSLASSIRATDSGYFTTSGLPTGGYTIDITKDENGYVVASWTDEGVPVSKYKATLDAASWTDGVSVQTTTNLVTTVSSSSTDTQYPSAKCVYDALSSKADTSSLATVATSGSYADLSNKPNLSGYQTTSNLVTTVSASSTDSQYPSAKLFYDTVGNIETILHNINSGT